MVDNKLACGLFKDCWQPRARGIHCCEYHATAVLCLAIFTDLKPYEPIPFEPVYKLDKAKLKELGKLMHAMKKGSTAWILDCEFAVVKGLLAIVFEIAIRSVILAGELILHVWVD
jgi:hypothetical protein